MVEIRFEVTAKFLQVWLIAGAMSVTADILLKEIGSDDCGDSNGGDDDHAS